MASMHLCTLFNTNFKLNNKLHLLKIKFVNKKTNQGLAIKRQKNQLRIDISSQDITIIVN